MTYQMHVKKETTLLPTCSAGLCLSSEVLEQVHGELSLHWLFSILTGLNTSVTSVQKARKLLTGMPYRKFNWANANTLLIADISNDISVSLRLISAKT